MTTIAGTPAYAREYQRRRAAGLPTIGLAEMMRAGEVVPQLPARKLRQAQQLYARGWSTSRVMAAAGISYIEAQIVRSSMEG